MTDRDSQGQPAHGGEDEFATLLTCEAQPAAPASVLRLSVLEGPDAGKAFTIDPSAPSRVLLGTGPACDIRLSDPSVSRRHAAFEVAGRRYRVIDLGSTNGTTIDGVAIKDAFVAGKEVLRCGSTAIRLDTDRAPPVALHRAVGFGKLLGMSQVMRRLYPLCERLAASTMPLVIEGETGTGKETLAESLHAASRRPGPFVVLDCTAVSSASIEAELFGCEADAGAGPERPGCFEEANGGTLFIDEIGELDVSLQPKLLRALERGEVRRLGARAPRQVEVRVIAATRRDLDKEVAAGRFRDDLFHRLAALRIELPALRHRSGDVQFLAQHFAKQMGAPEALDEQRIARFADDAWPGNVRELRNAVARIIALGELGDLAGATGESQATSEASSEAPGGWADEIIASGAPLPVARRRLVQEFERRYVERVLAEYGGNVSRAALASGIALRYFQVVNARRSK